MYIQTREAAVLLKHWAMLLEIAAGALAKAVTDSTYWTHGIYTN
jgi:hypothetical protein